MTYKIPMLAGVLCLVACADARAHFLFVRITPPAEAGRAVEVYFSEIAEAGDPRFIDNIAHTRLWVQSSPGKFQDLAVHKAADRLRAPLSSAGSVAVIGSCEYGVLERKTPFLLRYFPKAIEGKPAELKGMQPLAEVPLEIMADITGDGLRLTVLRDGKPMSGAELRLAAREGEGTGTAFKTGADGSVMWKPPAAGRYSIYTSAITKKAGMRAGKKYQEIRDFASLAFAWPLDPEPDAAAAALFQDALATRAHWKDFPGFAAHITGTIDGRHFAGTVTIAPGGSVETNIPDEVAQGWVQEQLESIVLHRGAGNSARATGKEKPRLRFADDDKDHPLGRLLIFEGGRFASSYRVKDKQIIVVNRHLGKENMTITVLDNDRNPEGRFLPRSYTVQYWDARTGQLKRTETIQERWQRVGSWDLPVVHTVSVASGTGLAVRSFTLSKHKVSKSQSGR